MSARTYRCTDCRMPAAWPSKKCVLCQQEGLFAEPQPNPSEQEIRLRDQQRHVLVGLLRLHARFPRGANAFELQAFLVDRGEDRGIERNAISSRFRELEAKGLVEKSEPRHAPTGKRETVYIPTAAAFEWRKRTETAA